MDSDEKIPESNLSVIYEKEDTDNQTVRVTNYDTLVLSGGAVKGLILLGALQCALDKYILNNIQTYVGTSIGAIIGYLLAIGYTPIEIMVYICTHKLVERMQYFNIVGITKGEGVASFRPIQETLEQMTLDKIGRFITLKDLHEQYGKTLICSTYNMTQQKQEYLSYHNIPELPCLIALRMTANVPFLFDKFKYMGNFYIDGAVSDNFPVAIAEKVGTKILGIRLYKEKSSYAPEEEIGVLEYIFKVLNIPIDQASSYKCSLVDSEKCTIVKIPENDPKMFDFNIKSKVKLDLFSKGYQYFGNCVVEE